MSELIQKNEIRDLRWKLLTEASVLALIGYMATIPVAMAGDSDRPAVWIELGGQLSQWETSQEAYAPPFVALTPSNLTPPQKFEKLPRYGMDGTAALTFQPENSDWTFAASIRYGRASNSKRVHQQSHPATFTAYSKVHVSKGAGYKTTTDYSPFRPLAARFTDAVVKQSQTNTIVDFQAGKDLGIGLFGRNASSTFNVGARFAQFTSKSIANFGEDPDAGFKTHIETRKGSFYRYSGTHVRYRQTGQKVYEPYHSFAGTFRAERSFSGVGPTISWNSSTPLFGNPQASELTLDWGMNAALLFGRQKAKSHHQTTERYSPGDHLKGTYGNTRATLYDLNHPSAIRSRSVLVPNIGGFAGISFEYSNAKVSLGYRGDFFFGAMDGGIDTRKSENVGFHGPFASVSVGIGG